jgi:hypothetical protein
MRLELPLRITAIAIAAAGIADPGVTRDIRVADPISIVVIDDPRLPPTAWLSVEQVRRNLVDHHDVTVRVHPLTAGGAACPSRGGCIVVSNGSIPARMSSGAEVLGAIRVPPGTDRGNYIESVVVPHTVSLHGAAPLDLHIARRNSEPIDVRVFDGAVLVGQTRLEGSGGKVSSARIEWIPVTEGARRLSIRAGAADTGETDDEAEIGVEVSSKPFSIVVYEPEATWLGTFVRRALIADARFKIDARTRLAPAITIGTNRVGPLSAGDLADAGVVVVTAPEALSSGEIDLLDRFARRRGGSVVLLPDRRPTGPVTRLMPPIRGDRREPNPRAVGALRASELLEFDAAREGTSVLERADNRPAIAATAIGRGRIITSGALDAWRYRDDGVAFDRFWSSMVAAAAQAAGRSLHVELRDALVAAGGETNLAIEWRTIDEVGPRLEARAELSCADGSRVPIRLWPAARPGAFEGKVQPGSVGQCTIEAAITHSGELAGSASLAVAEQPRLLPRRPAALESAIAAHGGLIVDRGEEAQLIPRTRERLSSSVEPQETRPLRSPWWIVPFTACLGAEWWLRRRRGLA